MHGVYQACDIRHQDDETNGRRLACLLIAAKTSFARTWSIILRLYVWTIGAAAPAQRAGTSRTHAAPAANTSGMATDGAGAAASTGAGRVSVATLSRRGSPAPLAGARARVRRDRSRLGSKPLHQADVRSTHDDLDSDGRSRTRRRRDHRRPRARSRGLGRLDDELRRARQGRRANGTRRLVARYVAASGVRGLPPRRVARP